MAYLDDENNDPHDWMVDDSALNDGGVITVDCTAGYNPIEAATIREFCDLAEGNLVSVCVRK